MLLNFIDTDLFERAGKAISNFSETLPAPQSDLAQEITKDPYNFNFLTLDEKYDEKDLKDALINNVSKLLIEMGSGFAYMGREYRLAAGQTEQFLDLLFYNTSAHCYVVVEVKTTKFEASFLGQLSGYVSCANHSESPVLKVLISSRTATSTVSRQSKISRTNLSKSSTTRSGMR